MPITIDARELQQEAGRSADSPIRVRQGVVEKVDTVSRRLAMRIKQYMPVDTGRARAGWGLYTPALLFVGSDKNPSSDQDVIWEVDRDEMGITQGTFVPYVVFLNEGTSSQAPAGFIDTAAEMGGTDLENEITQVAENTI